MLLDCCAFAVAMGNEKGANENDGELLAILTAAKGGLGVTDLLPTAATDPDTGSRCRRSTGKSSALRRSPYKSCMTVTKVVRAQKLYKKAALMYSL